MPRKLFSWRTSFVLPRNADLRTVTISYRVGYDDVSKDPSNRRTFRGCVHTIWVNGKPYVMKAKGNPIRTQCAATLPRNAVYRYGKNSLEFRIQNLATYYGFRFEKIRAHFQVKRPKIANLRLFSTGVNNANRPIGLKKTDTHWQVRMNNGKWFAARYDKTNYCTSCGRKWMDHPIGNNAKSRPLAHPKYMRKRMPRKLFSWRTFFTIPRGANLRTVVVSYKAGYDDVSKDPSNRRTFRGCVHTVWVNGKPYVMKAKGNPIRTQCAATIPMNAAYKHGKNSIEFRIQNLATYYGFRFEKVRATVQFGAASGSLGKVYRRRRRRMRRRARRARRHRR